MKKLLITLGILIGILLIAFTIVWFKNPPVKDFDNLAEFKTDLISKITYNSFKKKSIYLEMKDGTQLATDIFIPNGKKDKKYPVIFEYTPYNRSAYIPGLKWYEKIGAKWKIGQWGPIFDKTANFARRNLIARGYAFVVVDMRGTGVSSGTFIPLSPILGKDGAEIVNWIEKQNWSNGKVGMIGQSFHAWSQWATANNQPKALKCIAPALIMFDSYSEANRPGGILAKSWITQYSDYLQSRNYNQIDTTSFDIPVYPTGPVVDEDRDGSLEDEIPIMSGNPIGSFIHHKTPTYADGNKREHNYYFNYTKEHLKDLRPDFYSFDAYRYFDDITSDKTKGIKYNYYETSPAYTIPKVVEANIAVLNIGGWFDSFITGTTQLHASMIQNGGNSRLFIEPRFHQPDNKIIKPYVTYLNYKGDIYQQEFMQTLRFFDYYLKDMKNGWKKEEPIYLYTVHKGWQHYKTWPPASVKNKILYLSKNKLMNSIPDSSINEYIVDFKHASDYGEKFLNRWVLVKPSRQLMDRTELDKKTIIYETETMLEDTEITGHPIAEIFIGSNKPNADIFLYINDVDKNGQSVYVTEGKLRASWHKEYNPNLQVNNTYKVMPRLPWHGFEHKMEQRNPTANDSIVKMKFDLFPISWVFKKGHKLRISIAGVDRDNFELNPSWVSESGKLDTETKLFIYNGKTHASRIILPYVKN